jgi:creatinine amidohydrolase
MPRLHEMKWPEVKEYLKEKDVILIPVGSVEQHGLHAPLGTDSFVAIHLTEDASAEADVISAPPLWLGWTPAHMVLPGTISIEPSVLEALLFQEIRSLSAHGFKNFIVVNGHRIANLPWMQIAAQKAQSELNVRVVIFDPAYMSKEIATELGFGPGHGEEGETSQMLYIRPELIDLRKAVDSADQPPPLPGTLERLLFCPDDPRWTEDTLCYVPSTLSDNAKAVQETGGSSGKPSKSRVDLGERLHKHLVRRLVQVIQGMEKRVP